MDILVCSFSATGNTAKIAGAISERLAQLGATVHSRDITPLAGRKEPISMDQYDAVVFGSPIHSMRAPRLLRDWLATLDGQGKKCAMFFTYGGFQIHPAHSTTAAILRGSGFVVAASADFPGKHTFNLSGWQAMADRPGPAELELAGEYAEAISKRFSGEDTAIVRDLDPGPYTTEQLDQFESFRHMMMTKHPTRDGQDCQMCMLCQEECPSGAMDAEKGVADEKACICCLRCVDICPDEVLHVNDMSGFFEKKMNKDQETQATLKAKQGKIYL